MSDVVLFDMDRTLVRIDAFRELGLALLREGLVPRLRGASVVWAQVGYRLGVLTLDEAMVRAYGLVHGCAIAPIEAYTEGFVATVVRAAVHLEAVHAIEEHRASGHRVVLASASPDFLVKRVARLVGVEEIVATRIALDGDRFAGVELPGAWGAGKVELARRAGLLAAPPLVYTDHVGDLDVVLAARHATLVNPMPALVAAAEAHGIAHRVVRWSRPWAPPGGRSAGPPGVAGSSTTSATSGGTPSRTGNP